jgi:nickel-dependent lactate racemase
MLVSIKTNAWYGDTTVQLEIPETWKFAVAEPRECPALAWADLEASITNPIGSASLSYLAAGKRNAILLIEDLTRPLRLDAVAELLLDSLNAAGIADGAIRIIVANATHRPMTRHELLLKLGANVCRRVQILPHNCYEHLTPIGRTEHGTELCVNTFVAEADLIIGLGGVYPHGMAGFSGGGKIILPGVSGIESIAQNHTQEAGGYLNVEANPLRDDMEEAARLAGLGFLVNGVVNSHREICGLFAGDPIAAHRRACRFAREAYATKVSTSPDILILNAYPMDTELFQAAKALSVAERITSAHTLVLLAECAEGFGYHALCGPGGRMQEKEKSDLRKVLEGKRTVICSRNIQPHDLAEKFPETTVVFSSWPETVDFLNRELQLAHCDVLLFPAATIQIPA